MRKTDYTTLATILARELAHAERQLTGLELASVRASLRSVALQFATAASVKPADFLKACGL